MDRVLAAHVLRGTGLVLDEVHSFVLRININLAHGGKGKPRPQFQLEHVNKQQSFRTNSLEEACALLETRVKTIFDELGFGEEWR